MKRACRWIGAACLGMALLTSAAATAWAAPQAAAAGAQAAQPTRAEYDAYTAANAEKDPQARVKLLDDFVAKYPTSTYLPFVYRSYYLAYYGLKNYPQMIAYADKLLALGDKVDLGTRMEALTARGQAFALGAADKTLQTPDQLTKARDASTEGLKTLDAWKKPDNMTDDAFAKQKASIALVFDSVGGTAASSLKDYKGAATFYKSALALSPTDAVTHYHLGLAYLQDTPPQAAVGYWELSRALALKVSGDTQVRAYLKNQVLRYQMLGCDKLADDEINQWVTLAGTANDPPATLKVASADDLQKARDDTANFIPWLQEGGDHGQTMWLATCGLEYPDVVVRLMEVDPADGDNVTLKVYRPSAADPDAATKEMEAATTANMELHVAGQPDSKKLAKDDEFRFTGTVNGYTQSPFLLTWDGVKVNDDDLKDLLTPEKPASGAKRPTPGAKAPAKKP